MRRLTFTPLLATVLSLFTLSNLGLAQSAGTWVDVGPGSAGAGGSASGQFQHVDTQSRVGPFGSVASGVAVGAGPNGLAISSSIGVNAGGQGSAHNFNLSIGPGGAHVSGGNVNSQGGNSRVIAGGNTTIGGPMTGPAGGSFATGFGHHTVAHTHARNTRFPTPFGPRPMPVRSMGGPFGGPFGGPRF